MESTETLNIEMSPASLARMNESTRARERQKIAQWLDEEANRVADGGNAEAAIVVANVAERVRRMTAVTLEVQPSSEGDGVYGSKVAEDGTPIVADVVLADELPQVHLNSDETDAMELLAHDRQREVLTAMSRAGS